MFIRALKLITLSSLSIYSYADLPKDSQNLANYAHNLNSQNSNPNYRPLQVMANQHRPESSVRSSGFSTKYVGVRYSNKDKNNESDLEQPSQQQKLNSTAYKTQVQQNISRPTVRPATYTYAPNQYALNYDQIVPGRVATVSCVIHAARAEGVPLYVLLGIHSKERGNNGQTARNTDASIDMGQFQINTIHFKKGGMFEQYDKQHVKNDGCLNARLAAKLLKDRLNTKSSKDFWTRAAAYHSWTPKHNNVYKNGNGKNPGLIAYSNQWKNWLQSQGINPN